jgi:aminomethyltransferase
MKLISPFYGRHVEYGAKFREDGYQSPLMFTTPEEEYRMVRERAGFVDYCMQRPIAVVGRDAFTLLQKLLVNDLRRISPGKAIYSSMLDETGKLVEDLIIFWVEEGQFILNSLRRAATMEWVKKHAQGMEASVVEMDTFFLGLQGPKSREILQKAMNVQDLSYFGLKQDNLSDIPVLIARVGYSGELGYELYIHPEHGYALWDTLVELGKEHDVGPFGLTAGGMLSVEKGYLGGRDFYEGSTPLEIGLGWTVGWDKDFLGKDILVKRRNEGMKTKLMGVEVSDPNVIPAAGDNLVKEGKVVGQMTSSGAYGPTIGKNLGRGWVEIQYANTGEEMEIEHENKRTNVSLARYRWYDPENKKVRG